MMFARSKIKQKSLMC